MTIGPVTFDFQPIYDLTTKQAVGLEALARWPDRTPEEVFASARANGSIAELDRTVAYAALDNLPFVPPHLYLAVNATPEGLLGSDITRVPTLPIEERARIVVEVVEHTDVAVMELYERLRTMRSLGLRYAVDDVGVAHGNVYRIAQLLPDLIKIDRSLIHGVGLYAVNRAVVRAISAMAVEIRCQVVAEGVEDRDDLLWVASLGIRYAQGYHLCRPMALNAALNHLSLPG